MLAIDWEKNQLCGVEADVSRGRVKIKRCFTLTWPEDINPMQSPEAAGEWLKGQLAEAGVSDRQAIVALPREDAVVRHLELPASPKSEIPDLVRFQASTKSTLPLNQLHLDHLPLPARKGFEGLEVLMTTISKLLSDTIKKVLQTAGVELVSLGITPVAVAELISRVEQSGDRAGATDSSLIVSQHGNRVEISIVRQRALLFSHSARLGGDETEEHDAQSILAEISRSFVALQKTQLEISIGRAWVLGSEEETRPLVAALEKRMAITTIAGDDCDVKTIDPLKAAGVTLSTKKTPGNHTLYAGPVGMLLAREDRLVESVDFLNPRKPEVKPDRRIHKAGAIAAAVATLLLAFFGWRYFEVRSMENETITKLARIKELKASQKKNQPVLVAHGQVTDWVKGSVNSLDQMQRIVQIMDGTEQFYLSELRISQGTTTLGTITAEGAAKSRNDVQSLKIRINNLDIFKIQPNKASTNSRDSEYPEKFELNVSLQHPQPESPPKGSKNVKTKKSKKNDTRTGDSRSDKSRKSRVGGPV